MRRIPSVWLATVAVGLLLQPQHANAQSLSAPPPAERLSVLAPPPAERLSQPDTSALQQQIDQLKKEFGERIAALEAQLAGAQAATPPPPPIPPPADPAVSTAPVTNAKVFNPDMSVIGNFVGVAGKNDHSDQPPLGLSEIEMALQAIVDPFARADFFLAASPEGLEIEEGFITFNTLPGGLLLKAGKMKAEFGKVNRMHTHILPWADRPLVSQNLVGGEEGISLPGVSLSRLIQNPAIFLEATGEAYYGSSDVFESRRKSKLTYVGRLRGYRDITEATNIDIGGSYAVGPSTEAPDIFTLEDTNTELFGFDATFRYRPLRRAIYKRFQARTELVWSRPRSQGIIGERAFGYFGSGEYQFARRWFAGARYDRSAQALDPSLVDKGGSFYLTFWPSEFNQIRGQYRRTNYGDGVTANEFLFQLNFSIGAHGAHVF
jgi:hypothetical protein